MSDIEPIDRPDDDDDDDDDEVFAVAEPVDGTAELRGEPASRTDRSTVGTRLL